MQAISQTPKTSRQTSWQQGGTEFAQDISAVDREQAAIDKRRRAARDKALSELRFATILQKSRAKVMMKQLATIIVVAGLLTTSSYPATHAADLTQAEGKLADVYRLFNTFAFALSISTIICSMCMIVVFQMGSWRENAPPAKLSARLGKVLLYANYFCGCQLFAAGICQVVAVVIANIKFHDPHISKAGFAGIALSLMLMGIYIIGAQVAIQFIITAQSKTDDLEKARSRNRARYLQTHANDEAV